LAARLEDTVHRNTPDTQQDSRRLKLRFMFRYHDKQFDTSIYEHHGNSLVILHDITPLVRRLNTTNQLARNDALTGIHNRRSIETAVTQWLNHHQDSDHSFCFALFDVDHFKQFNDTYGHQVGDVVLKQITVIFNHAIRQTDLFGRFGGDEFILFLTDVNDDQARMILDRAVKNVTSEPVEVESGDMLSPTISMGAVFFPKTGSLTYEEIFNLADEALYYAKENGRNQITFRTRTRIDFNPQLY
jgi:two-component system cell cycle response regulator